MKSEYKNIEEQIELIKSKNIVIKDKERAKQVLLREGYYNLIKGYKDIFVDIKKSRKLGTETCDEETFFEEIYAVYKFDRDFRNLMFKYISIIETHIKSYISEVISQKYGTKNYLKRENFKIPTNGEERFNTLIGIIKNNIDRNLNNYLDIKKCYIENGDIPFWMLATLMTFGTIVKLYIFMKPEDKKEVAKNVNMDYRELQNYLKMLNIVRNISAHNNVLFNTKFDISYVYPNTSKYHDTLGIAKQNNIYISGINDMTAIIIILRRLLDDKEYHHLCSELTEIIDEIKEELDNESFNNLLEEIGLPMEYTKILNL